MRDRRALRRFFVYWRDKSKEVSILFRFVERQKPRHLKMEWETDVWRKINWEIDRADSESNLRANKDPRFFAGSFLSIFRVGDSGKRDCFRRKRKREKNGSHAPWIFSMLTYPLAALITIVEFISVKFTAKAAVTGNSDRDDDAEDERRKRKLTNFHLYLPLSLSFYYRTGDDALA